jgi:ABC-type glycerol-3-phosphate transport system permease component
VTAIKRVGNRPWRTRARRAGRSIASAAYLWFWAAITLLPMVLVISTAVKDARLVTADPFQLFSSFRPQNIIDAWTLGNFGHYLVNTIIITVPTVLGVIILSTMSGYALAQFRFPGRVPLFYLFIFGMMVPFFSVVIPLFFELRRYGLLDTYWAVILPSIAGAGGVGLPLGIFLMRSFFLDMPRELSDAARIDGADDWGVFRFIMVPLARPGAGVLAVLAFLSAWNTFLLPLIFMSGEDNRTLATGLLVFKGGLGTEVELLAASSLIMIAPVMVFFVVFQKQFVRGLAAGAVKG